MAGLDIKWVPYGGLQAVYERVVSSSGAGLGTSRPRVGGFYWVHFEGLSRRLGRFLSMLRSHAVCTIRD
jgi:hypothetical protein